MDKKYFKLGFFEGLNLYNEYSEYMSEKGQKVDIFFNNEENCFIEYIEISKMKKLAYNLQYKEYKKKISNIKEKYPRIQSFFEEEIIKNITDEEQKAIIEIRNIETLIQNLSDKIVYKLGMSEKI